MTHILPNIRLAPSLSFLLIFILSGVTASCGAMMKQVADRRSDGVDQLTAGNASGQKKEADATSASPSPTPVGNPSNINPSGGPVSNDPSVYLTDVKKSFEATRPLLKAPYELISKVEPLQLQLKWPESVDAAKMTADKKKRLSLLHSYFTCVKSIAAGLSAAADDSLAKGCESLVDPASGYWSAEMKEFAKLEKIVLPSALLIYSRFSDPTPMTPDQRKKIAEATMAVTGPSPTTYFSGVKNSADDEAMNLTRSLRYVKVQLATAIANSQTTVTQFKDFFFTGTTPDFAAAGFDSRIKGLSSWFFLSRNAENTGYTCEPLPIATTISHIKSYYEPDHFFFLDDWWGGCPELRKISFLRPMLKELRRAYPGMMLGFYAFWPKRDFWTILSDPSSQKYKDWQKENDTNGDELAEFIDVIYTSNYVLHTASVDVTATGVQDPGMVNWKGFAKGQIAEAWRLSARHHNQAVMAFLWAQYHPNGDNNPLGYQFMSGDIYGESVRHVIAQKTDGVVHWNYSQAWDPAFDAANDGSISWYEATLKVMSDMTPKP